MEDLKNKIIKAVEAVLEEYQQEKQSDKIVPAPPLRVMPEFPHTYFLVDIFNGAPRVSKARWEGISYDYAALQAGLCFPNTPEGKAGAELRAKQGILPPIDRGELRGSLDQLLDDLKNASQPISQDEMWGCVQRHHLVLESILKGGEES